MTVPDRFRETRQMRRARERAAAKSRVPLIYRPGVIAVVSSDRVTYQMFSASLMFVAAPAGTHNLWFTAGGGGVAVARNWLVRQALDLEAGWVWFIDDDHTFASTTLERLLRHDVDIVVPTVTSRLPPFQWIAWQTTPLGSSATDEDLVDVCRTAATPQLAPGQRGLIELGMAGTGGMLISAEVLQGMQDPLFEFGRLGADSAGEDTFFCLKARRAGYRIWCDLDTPMGHLTTAALWPQHRADGTIVGVPEFDHSPAAVRAHLR